MKWLLLNPLRTFPPLGLVAVGALAGAAGMPLIKKTARGVAVLTAKGVLSVKECMQEKGSCLIMSRAERDKPGNAAEGVAHVPVVEHPPV